jgi:hypothetical protein
MSCYLYDVGTNSWSLYSNGSDYNGGIRGVVHQGKIYLPDDANQGFDFIHQFLP